MKSTEQFAKLLHVSRQSRPEVSKEGSLECFLTYMSEATEMGDELVLHSVA